MITDGTGLGAPIGVQRNARVAHIRKFVCVPPARGHTLRLVAVEDPPTVLGEWPRDECVDNGLTADDVDARLRDHSNTLGNETIANLTWCAENAMVVCSKRLRCKPESDAESSLDPAMMAQAEALGIDGTTKGQAVQLGRALEGSIRLYMSAQQTHAQMQLQRDREQREMVQALGGMVRDGWQAAHAAHLELDKLRAAQRRELDHMNEALRESSDQDSSESSARAEFLTMVTSALTQALPLIVGQVARLMTEQPTAAPANTNATPAQASTG